MFLQPRVTYFAKIGTSCRTPPEPSPRSTFGVRCYHYFDDVHYFNYFLEIGDFRHFLSNPT